MKRRIWLKLAMFVGGGLVLLDIVLRLAGVGVPPPNMCDDGAPRGDFRYATRNRYQDSQPDDVSQYLVCFGDSWTYGLGVAAEETWPARLEELLRRHEPQIRVVNAAVADATTADMAALFKIMMGRYRAKRAVVLVGIQDATPQALLAQYPLGDPFKPRACPRPLWRLGHELGRRYFAFKLRLNPPDPPDNKEYLTRRGTVADTQIKLLALAQEADQSGYQVVFVTYPALPPAPRSIPYLPLESRFNFLIQAAAQSFSMGLCDLEKRWSDRTEDYLLPWMLWPHPNAEGHADIAKAVAEVL